MKWFRTKQSTFIKPTFNNLKSYIEKPENTVVLMQDGYEPFGNVGVYVVRSPNQKEIYQVWASKVRIGNKFKTLSQSKINKLRTMAVEKCSGVIEWQGIKLNQMVSDVGNLL